MFNGDGGGAMTGNNDVINNNKRTAVVYATEAGELYTVESERKYLLGSFKSGDPKLVRPLPKNKYLCIKEPLILFEKESGSEQKKCFKQND